MTISSGKLDRRGKKRSKITETHRRVVQNIKEIRMELNLSQRDVAEKLGIAQPTYCAVETARCDVLLGTLEQIAKILKQPVQMFFIREPHGV